MRSRLHTAAEVQRGIDRFLEDFRAAQSTDAEPEFIEPCVMGCGYPAALHGLCFTCLAGQARGLPA